MSLLRAHGIIGLLGTTINVLLSHLFYDTKEKLG